MDLKKFLSNVSIGFVVVSAIMLTGCANKDKEAYAKPTDQTQSDIPSAGGSGSSPAASKGNSPDTSSNYSSPSVASNSLVGKWEGQTEYLEFFADGTGAMTFKPHVPKDDVGKITWSGNTVQIGAIAGNATFSEDGKTLTLTATKTGYASKYKKLR